MKPYSTGLVDELDNLLPAGPALETGGSLLIMVGLPGAGKSFMVRHLRQHVPSTLVSTDQIRRLISDQPNYAAAEVAHNYEVCFALTEKRLARRQRVIFDGSNYLAARRQHLREIARRYQVPHAVVRVQASPEVSRARLIQRSRARVNGKGHELSDAGWEVYRWMVAIQEPIDGPHLVLDTSASPVEELTAQVYQYWMESERSFTPAHDYL